MKPVRNLFSYEVLITKSAVKKLQSAKSYAVLLVLMMLIGTFGMSHVVSTLTNCIIIRSTGRMSVGVLASSGSAEDIQAAVDKVQAAGGGNVYIPEGTFSFSDSSPWKRVDVPAGVNILGAPTERDGDDQVVEWKTVLQMPWHAPDESIWFSFTGTGDPNKPSRFSDIKLVGYRTIDSSSRRMYYGLAVDHIKDLRVDHCYFENIAGSGVSITGEEHHYSSGVIDHCYFVNSLGEYSPYDSRTIGYGIEASVLGSSEGPPPTFDMSYEDFLGKYTEYTLFVEDCYFSKWRHCTVCNMGQHVVFRYNTVQYDYGYGSYDTHEIGRATEIYNCRFIDAVDFNEAVWIRGGDGVLFNNYFDSSYNLAVLLQNPSKEDLYWNVPLEPFLVSPFWVWNNTNYAETFLQTNGPVENQDYWLHEPHLFTYVPYPYPHPLTL